MVGACISQEFKNMISYLLDTEVPKATLKEIVQKMPDCPVGPIAGESGDIPGAKRHIAEPWGIAPVYIDGEGREETFPSPSALVKHLGLPMSGTICDASGKKCRATSAIEILRISGYTVSGDGEPRKASEGGKVLKVYHPDALKEEK